MVTFKSIEIHGIATYPPHYLKKSLDFLAQHIDRYPYVELCDAKFRTRSEALDKSNGEVTRAALFRHLVPAVTSRQLEFASIARP